MEYAWDPMSYDEQQRLAREKQEKMGAFALLTAREAELTRIRDGSIKAKRASRKPSKKVESIAFKKYMALFWDRPKKLNVGVFFQRTVISHVKRKLTSIYSGVVNATMLVCLSVSIKSVTFVSLKLQLIMSVVMSQ